jgi:hypothetical protein
MAEVLKGIWHTLEAFGGAAIPSASLTVLAANIASAESCALGVIRATLMEMACVLLARFVWGLYTHRDPGSMRRVIEEVKMSSARHTTSRFHKLTPLTDREIAILKRNLHACYSRTPRGTDFRSFINDSMKFAHGMTWNLLRRQQGARGYANQWMWAEWRAYDRFQKLVAQLKRYHQLRPLRMAQLEACCEMATREKERLQAKRPFPKSIRIAELS